MALSLIVVVVVAAMVVRPPKLPLRHVKTAAMVAGRWLWGPVTTYLHIGPTFGYAGGHRV